MDQQAPILESLRVFGPGKAVGEMNWGEFLGLARFLIALLPHPVHGVDQKVRKKEKTRNHGIRPGVDQKVPTTWNDHWLGNHKADMIYFNHLGKRPMGMAGP